MLKSAKVWDSAPKSKSALKVPNAIGTGLVIFVKIGIEPNKCSLTIHYLFFKRKTVSTSSEKSEVVLEFDFLSTCFFTFSSENPKLGAVYHFTHFCNG